MERTAPINSVNSCHSTHLLLLIITTSISILYASASQELLLGFKSTPSPSISSFQPLLNDPSGIFSLGFLRVNKTLLTLSVVHCPTLLPLWQADPSASFSWSAKTNLFFNGSLVISNPDSGLFWSSGTNNGEKAILLSSSNLQIIGATTHLVRWESFDFPTNTLVQNQNFTSDMSLRSLDGQYTMRLGDNFIGLYAKFRKDPDRADQIYLRHKALEAKAKVIDGAGPIYARVHPDGFLGMYQNGSTPVDIESFNSFQRPIDRFLLVRLEPDGNLKGYSWAGPGGGADWVLEYQAIRDTCELPSPCGPYGLCTSGSGCSCLENRTEFGSGSCFDGPVGGDLCNGVGNDVWVLRRKGVDLPFKELMWSKTTPSLEDCEGFCENNCSCWGVVYNNVSRFCYFVDYPIQTMLGVGDESKSGYFKVRTVVEEKKKTGVGFWISVGLLCGLMLILIGAIGFGLYKIRLRFLRRRGVRRILEEEGGVSPGPYKDLGSASFKSIQMYSSSSSR